MLPLPYNRWFPQHPDCALVERMVLNSLSMPFLSSWFIGIPFFCNPEYPERRVASSKVCGNNTSLQTFSPSTCWGPWYYERMISPCPSGNRVHYSWKPLRGREQEDLCLLNKWCAGRSESRHIDGYLCDLNVGIYLCLNNVTSVLSHSFHVGKKDFMSNEANKQSLIQTVTERLWCYSSRRRWRR